MQPIEFIRRSVFNASQAEFAAIAKTRQSTVSRWEAGTLHPDRLQMTAIREAARERGIAWNDLWFFEVPAAPKAALEPVKARALA